MAKATTIKEIIAELSEIENQDQPIIVAYWLADLFEFGDGTPSPTTKEFGEIIETSIAGQDLFSEAYDAINDSVYDFMLHFGTCDTCETHYDLSSRDGRCGDCGECAEHCEHESEN